MCAAAEADGVAAAPLPWDRAAASAAARGGLSFAALEVAKPAGREASPGRARAREQGQSCWRTICSSRCRCSSPWTSPAALAAPAAQRWHWRRQWCCAQNLPSTSALRCPRRAWPPRTPACCLEGAARAAAASWDRCRGSPSQPQLPGQAPVGVLEKDGRRLLLLLLPLSLSPWLLQQQRP